MQHPFGFLVFLYASCIDMCCFANLSVSLELFFFMNKFHQIIKTDFIPVLIDFFNPKWHSEIPAEPGWYLIETNASLKILSKAGKPKGKRHYNLPVKIESNLYLQAQNHTIKQKGKRMYVVYSGQSFSLKARAREHSFGPDGTGCLALGRYPTLKQHRWCFRYLKCSAFLKQNKKDDPSLRKFVEQIWRSQNGWPILCSA